MSTIIPDELFVTDSYGGKKLQKEKASYFWGDSPKKISKAWKPKAKIPQLETIIELFNGIQTMIAGGAILASYDAVEYGDIDVFPMTPEAVKQTTDILSNLGYKLTKSEKHMLLYERSGSSSRPVQVILLHTDVDGDCYKILNRFDISICQIGVLSKILVSNDITILDISNRIMRTRSSMNVNSQLARLEKYNRRGYNVLDAHTPDELEIDKHANKNTNAAG